jgi:hypothetical protein
LADRDSQPRVHRSLLLYVPPSEKFMDRIQKAYKLGQEEKSIRALFYKPLTEIQ